MTCSSPSSSAAGSDSVGLANYEYGTCGAILNSGYFQMTQYKGKTCKSLPLRTSIFSLGTCILSSMNGNSIYLQYSLNMKPDGTATLLSSTYSDAQCAVLNGRLPGNFSSVGCVPSSLSANGVTTNGTMLTSLGSGSLPPIGGGWLVSRYLIGSLFCFVLLSLCQSVFTPSSMLLLTYEHPTFVVFSFLAMIAILKVLFYCSSMCIQCG